MCAAVPIRVFPRLLGWLLLRQFKEAELQCLSFLSRTAHSWEIILLLDFLTLNSYLLLSVFLYSILSIASFHFFLPLSIIFMSNQGLHPSQPWRHYSSSIWPFLPGFLLASISSSCPFSLARIKSWVATLFTIWMMKLSVMHIRNVSDDRLSDEFRFWEMHGYVRLPVARLLSQDAVFKNFPAKPGP